MPKLIPIAERNPLNRCWFCGTNKSVKYMGTIPNACPTPIKAIPIVATVVHELPVISETIEQIIHVATKKYSGDNI